MNKLANHDTNSPRVSVVVLNWNQKRLTMCCLEALARQTFDDMEIILVDNGSTDDSSVTLAKSFPAIRVIALTANHGFAGGNNIGILESSGEFIALLNNDTEADAHWLESLVNVLDAHREVSFCASKIVLHKNRLLLDTAGDYYTVGGAAGKIGHLDTVSKSMYNRSQEVFGACAGAAIYRRSMLADIGLFDEDFFIAQEDVDLSFRAQLRGHACLYEPAAVVYHHLNATLKTYSGDYVYYGHRNSEYVYLKNMPLQLLILTLPLHLLDILLSFFFFALKGHAGSFLKAKWDVLRNLRCILKKRREIQAARTVSVGHIWSILEKRWFKLKRVNLMKRL